MRKHLDLRSSNGTHNKSSPPTARSTMTEMMALMKVETVIRPDGLNKVKSTLEEKGFFSMTVDDVAEREKHGIIEATSTEGAEHIESSPNVKIEVVVGKDEVDFLIGAIDTAAQTGEVEVESIVVTPIIKFIKIRTSEIMTPFSLIEEASCHRI